jgi:hypothetical protein
MRLLQSEGGDGTVKMITILNDTGSDRMTLFDIDLWALGDLSNYIGGTQYTTIGNSSAATETLQEYTLDIQLITEEGEPWGPWFRETAVLRTHCLGLNRLSGDGIRRVSTWEQIRYLKFWLLRRPKEA